MSSGFAIISFRNDGPIKSWSAMRGANVHNSRLKPIEHAIEGAPAPRHLIGTRDLVADVKVHLRRAEIDPAKLRKNGVIAFEAVMTASPEFFEAGDAAARAGRLEAWVQAQKAFALKRWGAHRVASMVLHLDEKTPHIHLVVVPLELKSDKRRKDSGELRWSIVGRSISGPGRFDALQDDYAAAMAMFGLRRGERGSGRKHKPVTVYIAELDAREKAAQREHEAVERRRMELDAEAARLVRRGNLRQRCLEWGADLARLQVALKNDELRRRRERLQAERLAFDEYRAAEQGRLDAADRDVCQRAAMLERAKTRLVTTFASAQAFLLKIKDVPADALPASTTAAAAPARALVEQVRADHVNDLGRIHSVNSAHTAMGM